MNTTIQVSPTDVIRDEIARFVEAARKRSESDPDQRRRTQRRYHRSWPLRVCLGQNLLTVALHNASPLGMAFLTSQSIMLDQVIFVKLFCNDDHCPYVPAIVRHVTCKDYGTLVGCEFLSDDENLCNEALHRPRQ
jgi:hypothetical protein